MEDSLLRNLFRGYQKWVRPVQHANDTITVRFGLKISQLVDVVRNQDTEQMLIELHQVVSNLVHSEWPSVGCVSSAFWETLNGTI